MTYSFAAESLPEKYAEFEHLFRMHYDEMTARIREVGGDVSPFNPRLDAYFSAYNRNDLIFFTVRKDGEAVGHCIMYLTHDMHNRDLIAQEDVLYIRPEHRNGVGRKLTKEILRVLEAMGVKRVAVTALTDLRVAKIWERMGFKHTAHHMTYFF